MLKNNNNKYLFYVTLSYSFGVLRPIEKVIKKRGGRVAWFIPKGSEATKFLNGDDIHLSDVAAVIAFNSDAVIAPGNYMPDFFPGIKVQVFHGFDSGKKNKFNIRGFFDLYCTQGPNITNSFNAINDGTCEIKETGWSKLDPLFSKHHESEQYKAEPPVLLYAPTFSPKLTSTFSLYPEIKRLISEKEWHWWIKLHPKATQEEIEMYKGLSNSKVKFVETGDIIPLLKAADIIISDTSSVLAEFALQGKVAIAFNNRKPAPWLLNFTEVNQFENILNQGLNKNEELLKNTKEYCESIHPYKDGKSSERVVNAIDEMINTGTAHLKPKPLNLIRRFKMRKKLNYWKI